MKGLLVVLSGPSGSGKGTVVDQLTAKDGYSLSVSITTRKPRKGEVDGRNYFFATRQEFELLMATNALLEHAEYINNYYGTPRKYVNEQIASGEVVILEIEVMGALQVKEVFPDALLIFMMPPTLAELRRRLTDRNTEDPATIESRLEKAKEEVAMVDNYDYIVINDTVDAAVRQVEEIIAVERSRPTNCVSVVNHFLEVVC